VYIEFIHFLHLFAHLGELFGSVLRSRLGSKTLDELISGIPCSQKSITTTTITTERRDSAASTLSSEPGCVNKTFLLHKVYILLGLLINLHTLSKSLSEVKLFHLHTASVFCCFCWFSNSEAQTNGFPLELSLSELSLTALPASPTVL